MEKINPTEFAQLKNSKEGMTLDFKAIGALSNSIEFAKSLTAFANTLGGTILLGIKNNKAVEGLKYSDGHVRSIVTISRDKCDPPLAPTIKFYEDQGVCVYIIEIERFSTVPHGVITDNGTAYFIRVGESVRETSTLELQKLFSSNKLTPEKKPILEIYFVDKYGELTTELTITPDFPVVEERISLVAPEVWNMYQGIESTTSILQNLFNTEPDSNSIKLDDIKVAIVNSGDAPAKEIRLTLEFPKDCQVFSESDLWRPGLLVPINLVTPSRTQGGLYTDKKCQNISHGWVSELGNDLQVELDPIFPKFVDKTGEYEVLTTITQYNYPVQQTKLKIKVEPTHSKIVKMIRRPDPTIKLFFKDPTTDSPKKSN